MSADGYTLIIGDKNFSSWSLRLWLAMKHCGIPFAEERIRLRQPESKAAILRHSPSGKVPALKTNGLVVFDSLAILEFLAERHPKTQMWPHDPQA
ncbi:MAG: glutathione S-transferase N-terminal domain-containing protein, partial [Methyloceanibacter sp.]